MNILTFDIEEWYLEKELHGGRDFRYRQFDETFSMLMDELDRLGIKATFFCVGRLAKDFPNIIKTIVGCGHEVGCHSNTHTWLDKMTPEEVKNDTIEALKVLEDVSGEKVVSYRAPAFSITPHNKWAVNVLVECGIQNDASIFPTNRDFGGYKSFPQDFPCIIENEGANMKEYPVSLVSVLGKSIAYSGGGYFRLLPYWFISRTMKRRDYNICYFHLNDLIHQKISFMSKAEYEDYFKEPGTLKNRLVRYAKSNVGTGDSIIKMEKLLQDHTFTNLRDCDLDWTKINTIVL